MTQALSKRIVEIAHARRRFGYRRIHDLLRCEHPGVNHKRVYRLYSAANLAVKQAQEEPSEPAASACRLQAATTVNEVWSMDFVSDSLSNGRRLKCPDRGRRLQPRVRGHCGGLRHLGRVTSPGCSTARRCSGATPAPCAPTTAREFTSRAFMAWAHSHGVRHILIEPGRPMQNGYIESFNGKFRDEVP